MSHGTLQGRPGDRGTDDPARYGRLRQLGSEFAKFAVIGVTGVVITNAVYDVLFLHLGVGPVTSTTIATVLAAIATYLGNRYWSFRARQRTGVVREIVVFAVLNGIGLLVQDAAVGFNYYLLHLGHNKLAGLAALNTGIALATLFRFWSYRRFVWVKPPGAPDDGRTGHRGSGDGLRGDLPSPALPGSGPGGRRSASPLSASQPFGTRTVQAVCTLAPSLASQT